VVTSSPAADAWRRTARVADPTLTRVGVFTADSQAGQQGRLTVDASSLASFRAGWHRLAGARSLASEPHGVGTLSGLDPAAARGDR